MTSQQIEYVLTLAELRSFSKAARKLYVTQPSLSQYIMSVEKQLGAALFDRGTTPIRLTAAGESFVRSAEKIKALEENLKNELADIANLRTGTLKIGASTFRASCLLPRSLFEFTKSFAGIEVSVTEGETEQLKEMVKNGELDIIVGTGEFDLRAFHTEELAEEKLYLAVPVGDKLADKLGTPLTAEDIKTGSLACAFAKPVDLSKLPALRCILTEHGEFGEERINAIGEKSGFKPEAALRVRTLETAFAMVTAGLGISFIPDTLVKFGNFSVHPLYYPLGDCAAEKILLVSRKNGYFSKASTEYCLLLKKLVDIGTWRVQ